MSKTFNTGFEWVASRVSQGDLNDGILTSGVNSTSEVEKIEKVLTKHGEYAVTGRTYCQTVSESDIAAFSYAAADKFTNTKIKIEFENEQYAIIKMKCLDTEDSRKALKDKIMSMSGSNWAHGKDVKDVIITA